MLQLVVVSIVRLQSCLYAMFGHLWSYEPIITLQT